jgi:hypothetical protein
MQIIDNPLLRRPFQSHYYGPPVQHRFSCCMACCVRRALCRCNRRSWRGLLLGRAECAGSLLAVKFGRLPRAPQPQPRPRASGIRATSSPIESRPCAACNREKQKPSNLSRFVARPLLPQSSCRAALAADSKVPPPRDSPKSHRAIANEIALATPVTFALLVPFRGNLFPASGGDSDAQETGICPPPAHANHRPIAPGKSALSYY